MAAKNTKAIEQITNILELSTGTLEVCVLGTSPLVMNRMSEKAKHEFLLPRGRMTARDKQSRLKHEPIKEFNAAPYRIDSPESPTLLCMPATAFKGAMCGACLDIPGLTRRQVERLTWVQGEWVEIYGKPELYMAIVRSSDMNRTPDVRTRAILSEWAARVTLTFVQPLISGQAVANLLAAGGIIQGIGDGRQEKGKLSFGQFRLVNETDKEFQAIRKKWGREAQIEAMDNPVCYDRETRELLAWYDTEIEIRRKAGAASVSGRKRSKKEEAA